MRVRGLGTFPDVRRLPQIGYLRLTLAGPTVPVPTLALRLDGKPVPIAQRQSTLYDGGIAAYFGSPMLPQIGAGYFAGYTQPFDFKRASRGRGRRARWCSWAEGTRAPPCLHNQGHAALLLPSGYVLQSNYGDGLNWKYTLAQSHGWRSARTRC